MYITFGISQKDYFDEELLLKPLPSGHVYAYFQFTTLWDVDPQFNIAICFPGPWVKLSGGTMFKSCTLLLQKGSGDMKIGAIQYLTLLLVLNCGHGSKKTPKSALSGLLCASLNFIDAANSLSPELTLRPAGVVDNKPVNSSYLRYATLPREIVCTENLTPWKKLLPCDSKDTSCSKMAVELRQTVSLVYDIVIVGAGSQDWSLRKLFGMGLGGACPLATMSNIYIDITSNKTETPFQLVPPAPAVTTSIRGGYETILAVYDVKSLKISSMFNVAVVHTQIPQVFNINSPPVIFANRYIVGYGQERGGIVTKIHINHWKSLNIVYLENIPWFLPVYFHTLKIVANGKEIKPGKLGSINFNPGMWTKIDLMYMNISKYVMKQYIPGKERTRPYYLEVALKLPGRSVTEISIDFDYVFLKWQEYPPDANHGFYIGSAIITALLPVGKNYTGLPQDGSTITSRLAHPLMIINSVYELNPITFFKICFSFNATREGYLVQLRTETLIITLPTPDFSMPYNVICLACTVVALAFGPLHNITTKRLRLKDNESQSGPLLWIKTKISALRGVVQEKVLK
uniref:GPI transamidase component PIG-T n=1 Tax=Timema shepardi TaxID=629360 RepID=A0A7R9FV84_TIMSH|nr:unnamed protein product [Timema shepardi]